MRATNESDPRPPAAEEALRHALDRIGGTIYADQEWDEEEGPSGLREVAVSYDGRWLATASASKVRVFDLTAANQTKPRVLEGTEPIVFSPDGHWLNRRRQNYCEAGCAGIQPEKHYRSAMELEGRRSRLKTDCAEQCRDINLGGDD